jgi:tetratricopeptide (TPR) repeat protein
MELGRFITNRRKELGKKQSDLADEQISVAYISGMENGRFQPTKGKLAHLCSKLDLTTNELENLLKMQEQEVEPTSDERLKLELFAIEDDMDSENLEDGYRQLKALAEPLASNDALMVIIHHLKGKYYLEKGKWKQAITQFTQSIQKLQLHERMKNSNLEAACYCGLSRISNYLNNVLQALHYTKKGLNAFVPDGERTYIQHHLLIGQAIYFSSLNQTEEAMQILDTMWEQMGYVKSSQVLLNMYELKAHLLNKTQKYGEAISVAKKGLELARVDRAYERKFELWTTLGTSFLKLQKLEEAKRCFQAADKLTKKVKNEYLFIRTKTQLGLLHLQENNIPLATTTLKEAVQLGKKTKDYSRLYEATIALGDCYLKQQNEQQAQTYYELGLKLSQELSLEEQIPAILLRLAKCTEKHDRKSYDFYTSQFIELSVKSTLGGDSMLFTTQIEHPYIKREADPPPH